MPLCHVWIVHRQISTCLQGANLISNFLISTPFVPFATEFCYVVPMTQQLWDD